MSISLLVSVVYYMLRDDPQGFRTKLSERLRQLGVPGASAIAASGTQDDAHLLAARGELSAALALIAENPRRYGRRGKRVARRLEQQLEELHLPPPVSSGPRAPGTGSTVLYLLTNSLPYTNSGYTQRSHQSLRAMRSAGVDVAAVTRLAYPVVVGKWPRSRRELIDAVVYHRLLPCLYPASARKRQQKTIDMVVELAKSVDAGAIHTTTSFPNAIVASRAAEQLGIPWIYEVRGELEKTWLASLPRMQQDAAETSEYYELVREQEIRYAKAADAVVALSEISRQQLISRGVAADRISVIPNSVGADLLTKSFDRDDIRRDFNLPTDRILVGSVSSLVDYEGFDILIHALKELPENYMVLLVGEGTARPELERLAQAEGLSDRVIFAGRKPQEGIWKWYAALDVFVVPRHDTPVCRTVTPIKALTAQALGIPVVASDLPALREVTGEVADYVPAGDSNLLARTILGVQDGARGRTWASSRTWNSAGSAYRALYQYLRA